MKIPSLPNLSNFKGRRSGSGSVAVVHWDKDRLYYFVGTLSQPITNSSTGVLPLSNPDKPMMALAEFLQESKSNVNQVVALISRPQLDLSTLTLPKGDVKETASMVLSELEQQYGDSADLPIADFVLSMAHQDTSTGAETNDVMVFAAQTKFLESLQEQTKESGLKLVGVGARHLGPLSLVHRRGDSLDTLTVAIQFYPGETELSICHGGTPVLLRSIRNSTEDAERVAEQVSVEVERCLTLLPHELASKSIQLVFLGTNPFTAHVAEALSGSEARTVVHIDPTASWPSNGVVAPSIEELGCEFAANIGAAWDYFHKTLPIDLLAPKRPPKPANPWIKRGGLAVAATAGVAAISYVFLGNIQDLQLEVEQLESEFADVSKLTNKYLEKADRVKSVEDWLANQVDWLAELNEISQRLPDGQNATVRRLTGSLGAAGSAIDLSVQVNAQEYISVLEDRLKSAKYSVSSRQISQSPDTTDYPWNFETRISFAVDAPSWKSYGPPATSPSDEAKESSQKSLPAAETPAAETPMAKADSEVTL
ncbi:hypothetical protein SH449x_001347 [Pirellulaceae bacterium SH449]